MVAGQFIAAPEDNIVINKNKEATYGATIILAAGL